MKLAVIPARGGSKRIPRKNIRPFRGKPMIAYSIAAARGAGLFDRVIVSTDDAEIAAIAKSLGAEVPFIRPADLSDDQAGTIAVIRHAITWAREAGLHPDHVCCIYATAPFLRADDLRASFELMQREGACFSFPVTSFPFPIQRAVKLEGGRLAMFMPDHFASRSQDLEPAYHDAGQFYWGEADAFMADHVIFGPQTVPLVIPRWRVQDLDTAEDWERAEIMYDVLEKQGRLS